MNPDGPVGAASDGATGAAREDSGLPLVTVIVRSMDRPELDAALASIAQQDHPAIEVLVVDATGGRHAPLRPQPWKAGHSVRIVSSGVLLKRPLAGQLGLASAAGEWFTFLDDDDTCGPAHLSSLLAAARDHPTALVVYGRGRLFNAAGTLDHVFGRPFNRALMHYGPLFYWQAALIRTRVRDLGCAFDPAFDVCEDRDLLAQIAEHGDFVYAPRLATFNYRPDLGTSGTGGGGNRNFARVARFENLLRAKWAGQGSLHNERVALLCRRGVQAYRAGYIAASAQAFGQALDQYPDDPNALHGMARVALAQGNHVLAEQYVRQAIEINPMAAEYRATLAQVVVAPVMAPAAGATSPTRVAACPCGSGRRFKDCCGRIEGGTTTRAATANGVVESLCAQAQRALDCSDAPAAFDALQRAAAIHCDARVGRMLDVCCERLAEGVARASLWSMVQRLRDTAGQRPVPPPRRAFIIASEWGAGADAEARARAAGDLGPEVEICYAGSLGELASGTGMDCESCVIFGRPEDVPLLGVEGASPGRVVIRLPHDDPAALIRAYARIAYGWPDVQLDYYRTVNL
jgi:tetratricopeptide (TPR) repeat protein